MMRRLSFKLGTLFMLLTTVPAVAAERVTLEQVLQRVIDTYPSLEVAEKQLARTRYEIDKIESQLGWTLSGQAGISRDLSIIGTPTDRSDVSASMQRKLSSGSTLDFGAGYTREDTTQTFTPLIPNPLETTNVDISLRKPFGRGADNPEYTQGLVSAETQVAIARADRYALHDQVARQVADLFYAAALNHARLRNAEQTIQRAKRLQRYVQANARLGIAEEKDLLQAEAQLRQRVAEHRTLQVAWNQQRTSLNRLMGRAWDNEFTPQLPEAYPDLRRENTRLINEAEQNSPGLLLNRAQLSLAEANIQRSRDAVKNTVDVIFSVGNRTRSGNAVGGKVDDTENVGGVRLEYNRALDKRGVTAELFQAQLDRDIALEGIRQIQDDLRYQIPGLLAEIEAAEGALVSQQQSVASERMKLKEAEQRYRQGRTETDRLIQYESDLHAAELLAEQQAVELARRHTELSLLRGTVWEDIISPRNGQSLRRGEGIQGNPSQ